MSDFELYKLLEKNNFKPTDKNLSILKEGLQNGKYSIVNSSIIREDSMGDTVQNIKANSAIDNYGIRSVAKEEEKEKGNLKGYVAPVVLTLLGLPLIGAILAVCRHKKNREKVSAKEEELRRSLQSNPKAKKIADEISKEALKPNADVNKLRDLKIQLKDALKESKNLTESFIDYIFDENNFLTESYTVSEILDILC